MQLQVKSMVFHHATVYRKLTNYCRLFFGVYSHSQTKILKLSLRMKQEISMGANLALQVGLFQYLLLYHFLLGDGIEQET